MFTSSSTTSCSGVADVSRRSALAVTGFFLALFGGVALACSDDEAPAGPAFDGGAPVLLDGAPSSEDAEPPPPPFDASTPYCERVDASSLVFCQDFESASAPLYGFDEGAGAGDGSAGDGGTAASVRVSDEGGLEHPSRVLDVTLVQPADAGDAGAAVFLLKRLPAAAGGPSSFAAYEVEVDFRIVGPSTLAYAALTVLEFSTAAIEEHGFAVYEGNVFGRLAPKEFAVRDDESLWHHARIVVSRAAAADPSSFTTRIDIDGTLVDNAAGVDPGAAGGASVRIGAFGASASGGTLRAQLDNVVIRRR